VTRVLGIALAFAASGLGSVGFALTYLLGGQTQLEGLSLAVALGGLGVGLGLWGKGLTPADTTEEEWEDPGAGPPERARFREHLVPEEHALPRHAFLLALLGGALGTLGLAALLPLRSLGPAPGRALFRTAWRPGVRLVTADGDPVRLGDLDVGGMRTVFPEGHTDAADSQTLLIRLESGRYRARRGRENWAPGDHVAFSKVCTHAGCPVGLYQPDRHRLICPCHQGTFDVLDGARPIFGPVPRPLPQLPLEVDGDGFLRAQADYDEPVGPGFWNRELGS
jgi:ubiquinol-cytochrome c reductase iron-sulfur subunit